MTTNLDTPTEIVPLGNYVLLRVHKPPESSKGGVLLPPAVAQAMMPTLHAKVLAIGEGRQVNGAEVYRPRINVGDETLIQPNAGVRVEHGGEELVLTTTDMLLCVFKKKLALVD